MGFLPANFQPATPFHSRLRSGTGQTDGQTDDGHKRLMPILLPGRRHNKAGRFGSISFGNVTNHNA